MYVIDWLATIKSAAGRRNFGDSCNSPVSVPASNPLAGSPPVAPAQRLCPSTAGLFRQLPIATLICKPCLIRIVMAFECRLPQGHRARTGVYPTVCVFRSGTTIDLSVPQDPSVLAPIASLLQLQLLCFDWQRQAI